MNTTTDFYIGGYVGSNCHIFIEDNTTYPFNTKDRDEYGIALFWSNNSFTDSFNDLTNSTTGWDTNPIGGGMWEYIAFIAPIWDVANSYAPNCIVYYNGGFYYADPGGTAIVPGGNNPSINTNWILLDYLKSNDNYDFFQLAITGGCNLTGQTFTTVNKHCGDLSFEQTSCLNWTICNTTDSNMFILVKDSAGAAVDITTDASKSFDYYIVPAEDCIDITLPESGVYIIDICHVIDVVDSYKTIYEFCEYWNCYFDITKNILCNDTDPCCEPCDTSSQKQNEIYRLQLNKMMALMNNLKAKISYDTFAYWNTGIVDDTRADLLEEINDTKNKLDDIIIRCGLCNGAQSNDVVTPCGNC